MKQRLYSHKFVEERGIRNQLDEFNKLIDDLENIDVTLKDEDRAIILLNALPKSFKHLKYAMLFGREDVITMNNIFVLFGRNTYILEQVARKGKIRIWIGEKHKEYKVESQEQRLERRPMFGRKRALSMRRRPQMIPKT